MLGEVVERAEDGEEEERDGERGPGEGAAGEAPDVQDGARVAQLPEDEADEADAGDDGGRDRGGAPAEVRALDDHVDERADPDDGEQSADVVEPVAVARLGRRHEEQRAEDAEDGDRHVDEEAGVPAVLLQQRARDQGAGGDAEARGGGPDGDGLGPFGAREGRGEQRERGRHDEGRPDAHQRARRDDRVRAVGQRSGDGGHAEDHEAEHERATAAVLVADRAEQQHQRGVRDGVAVDDPLEVGTAQVQVDGHVGGGHRQGGVRHDDDQQAEAEHPQRCPALSVRPVHLLDRRRHDDAHPDTSHVAGPGPG